MSEENLLPALSVQQPWAELILRGEKTIEIRSWTDSYRGKLYLHTGKKADGYRHITMGMADVFRGGYVGIIELAAILPFTPDRWEKWRKGHLSNDPYIPGLYAWIIRNPRRFVEPIPGPGSTMIFQPSTRFREMLKKAIFVS